MQVGIVEERLLDLLQRKKQKISEILLILQRKPTESNRVTIHRSLKRLIDKGLIERKKNTYHFIKYPEITAKLRVSNNQKLLTIPNNSKTKSWKKGDEIELKLK